MSTKRPRFIPRVSLRVRLIDDIDRLFRFSSTRIALVGAAVATASPVIQAWDVVPDSFKATLPKTLTAAIPLIIICFSFIIARATTTRPPTGVDDGTGTRDKADK